MTFSAIHTWAHIVFCLKDRQPRPATRRNALWPRRRRRHRHAHLAPAGRRRRLQRGGDRHGEQLGHQLRADSGPTGSQRWP